MPRWRTFTGLSSPDPHRLVAEVGRLRHLVSRVEPWVSRLQSEARDRQEVAALPELAEDLEREVKT